MTKTASAVLTEQAEPAAGVRVYDVFLSHRYPEDPAAGELVVNLKAEIEELGLPTFVDWIDQPELDRSAVDRETADALRARISGCKCLLFATTRSYEDSVWMPWELGFADGRLGRAAIVPITTTPSATDAYAGSEYLGLYPYITKGQNRLGDTCLWVRYDSQRYVRMQQWLAGREPYVHA
jgi:hypothetical protein